MVPMFNPILERLSLYEAILNSFMLINFNLQTLKMGISKNESLNHDLSLKNALIIE